MVNEQQQWASQLSSTRQKKRLSSAVPTETLLAQTRSQLEFQKGQLLQYIKKGTALQIQGTVETLIRLRVQESSYKLDLYEELKESSLSESEIQTEVNQLTDSIASLTASVYVLQTASGSSQESHE